MEDSVNIYENDDYIIQCFYNHLFRSSIIGSQFSFIPREHSETPGTFKKQVTGRSQQGHQTSQEFRTFKS